MDTLYPTHELPSEIADNLFGICKLIKKLKKGCLAKYGLTSSQFEILKAICDISAEGREIIQINLSERTKIDPMSTSVILRALQRKGFVTRQRSKKNTRTIIIDTTPKGKIICQKSRKRIEELFIALFQNINRKVLEKQLYIILESSNQLNC